MKSINNILKLLVLLVVINAASMINSCQRFQTELRKPYCPELPQGCYPGAYNGLGVYDTTHSAGKGYYFRIERVQGLNSPDDEWQLGFIDVNKYVFTYSESGLNKSVFVRKLNPAKYSIDKGINGLPDGHSGGFSGNNGKVAFASAPQISRNIVKEHNDYHLANIDDVIGKSRIYSASIKNDMITDLTILPDKAIGNLGWASQPTFSEKGNCIIFSSDMDGGFGGTDLWLIFNKTNGQWTEPINLGTNVNSKCDDITPSFDKTNNRLYFSSAGHNTVGGYDLFYCEVKPKFWTEIENFTNDSDLSDYFGKFRNLGTPVNTISDEIFPTSPDDFDEIIYYSSNQDSKSESLIESKGGFDLFVCHKIKLSKPDDFIAKQRNLDLKVDIKIDTINGINLPAKDVTIKGKVMTKSGNNPIDSAQIILSDDDPVSKDIQYLTDKKGTFEFPIERNRQYDITAQKKEYFYDSKRIFVGDDYLPDTLNLNFFLPEIGEIRLNFPTDEFRNPYKFTLDSNGTETGRLWTEELKLVAANIKLALGRIDKIVLVGHTDDVGTDEYNIGLGQRRVDFVVSELVKLGIPIELLITRSAGEREPLIRNINEDLSVFRKRLRRVTMEKFFK